MDKLLGVTSFFARLLFLSLVFVYMPLLATVLTRQFLLSICEGKMAQLGRLSNIRAIYTKKSKPRIAQTAAYIRCSTIYTSAAYIRCKVLVYSCLDKRFPAKM